MSRFLRIEAAAGGVLLIATLCAIGIANSPLAAMFEALWQNPLGITAGNWSFTRSLREWVNQGLMTIFFFVIALELKREIVVGELNKIGNALLPLAGALGGMVVPAAIYAFAVGDQPALRGWGTVMATDTAFVVAALGLFGQRIPAALRVFLLALAIFDDIGSIATVAVVYSDRLLISPIIAAAFAVAALWAVAFAGIRSLTVYGVLGVALWLLLDRSGIHPTVAGVVLGLMTPATAWVDDVRLHAILGKALAYSPTTFGIRNAANKQHLRQARVAATEAVSPAERLEFLFHPWAGFFVMPIFALANAGIAITPRTFSSPVFGAICLSLVIGKPVGVIAMSWLAVRTGIASKPRALPWTLLAAGALLTGIGFTMSLFIADLAFTGKLLAGAKSSILVASALSASISLAALACTTRGHRPLD